MRASDINDAKNRAFRLLEMFEKSVTERNASEATKTFQEVARFSSNSNSDASYIS